MPFPILNVHRAYNSVNTTVLHCDIKNIQKVQSILLEPNNRPNARNELKTLDTCPNG